MGKNYLGGVKTGEVYLGSHSLILAFGAVWLGLLDYLSKY